MSIEMISYAAAAFSALFTTDMTYITAATRD